MTMIGIEGVLIVVMLIMEPADAVKYYPSRSRVLIVCNTTTRGLMAPLCFDFFLIGMCTVYAVKTRNLPENFNEAKFIGFAMYVSCAKVNTRLGLARYNIVNASNASPATPPCLVPLSSVDAIAGKPLSCWLNVFT